jgi:hypothetical protein
MGGKAGKSKNDLPHTRHQKCKTGKLIVRARGIQRIIVVVSDTVKNLPGYYVPLYSPQLNPPNTTPEATASPRNVVGCRIQDAAVYRLVGDGSEGGPKESPGDDVAWMVPPIQDF